MPSRRQRKARAAAAAAEDTQAGMVSSDLPHPSPVQVAVSDFYHGNYEQHVTAAVAAANGDFEAYRSEMVSQVLQDYVAESQEVGHVVTHHMLQEVGPRMERAFGEWWDGQVPASSDGMLMALHVEGQAKIARRVGKGTGAKGPGAKHPGAQPTMEEMIVEAKHRSEGKRGTAQEQKRSQKGALEEDLGGRQGLPKPRSMGCIDEKVWSGAVETARGQVKKEYAIPGTLDAYYIKMWKPSRMLLAGEVHRRAQLLYDYRAGKAIYRENRKLK